MSSDEKPEPKEDRSAPSLEEVDSHWDDDEDLDEDATTVARIPQELMALSRRGNELEKPGAAAKKPEEPEKHEAITARPPPPAGEQSVVVDAPHERLAAAPVPVAAEVAPAAHEEEEEPEEREDDEDEEPPEDGWDIVEQQAAAADEAAGLDAEARRKAADARAAARKEKARAKTLAAKEKRKARADAQKQKQKKPRKRSTPPPRDTSSRKDSHAPERREQTSDRPAARGAETVLAGPKRDVLRMVFFVAIVVVIGALVIGLARR